VRERIDYGRAQLAALTSQPERVPTFQAAALLARTSAIVNVPDPSSALDTAAINTTRRRGHLSNGRLLAIA
jgi:hypothetical protein